MITPWSCDKQGGQGSRDSACVHCKPDIMQSAFPQEREHSHTDDHARFLARPSGGAGARLSALFRASLRRSGGRRQVQVADAQARLREPRCDIRDAPAEGDSNCIDPSVEPHLREPAGAAHPGGERANAMKTVFRVGSLPRARRLLPGLLSWKRGSQEPRAHAGIGEVGDAAVPDMPATGNAPDLVFCTPGHGYGDMRTALEAVDMLLAEAQRVGADAVLQQLLHALAHVCSTAIAGAHLPCLWMLDCCYFTMCAHCQTTRVLG